MPCLRSLACLMLCLSFATPAMAIDTYIVAGQSNGWRISHLKQGRGGAEKAPKVHHFGMDCVAEPESAKLVTLTALDEGTMGFALARALSQRQGKDIVFIQYCRCGAPVLGAEGTSWWPGEDPASGKTFDQGLFGKLQKYVASVRSQVKEHCSEELEIKGLFWHQGESNIGSDKAEFERATKNLFGRFRSEFGAELPIVAGHIRDLGEGPRGINAAIDRIAAQDTNVLAVPLTGLQFEADRDGKPDVHIALPGCHELGRRMSRGLSALELRASVTKAGGIVAFATDDPTCIAGVNLYNGNNPLKGKGGKNEAVTDAWLENLSGCTTLKKLDLSNCSITNEGLKRVGQLTSLEELNLSLTVVSDEGLQHLAECTKLRVLGLASTQCTGSGFAHLGKITGLQNVNFHFTPLDDAGLRAISQVGVKGRLWFAHTKFTDEGAKSLAKLKDLKTCGMGSTHPESSGNAVASLAGLPVEDLSLLDHQATAEGISHAAAIQSLRRLDCSYAPKANDAALALVAKLPHLEEFRIGGAGEITDAGIAAFAQTKSLKKLALHQLKKVSPQAVADLSKARPDLLIEVK